MASWQSTSSTVAGGIFTSVRNPRPTLVRLFESPNVAPDTRAWKVYGTVLQDIASSLKKGRHPYYSQLAIKFFLSSWWDL